MAHGCDCAHAILRLLRTPTKKVEVKKGRGQGWELEDFALYLKDKQNSSVTQVALIGVLLHVTQSSQDLEALADTRPAPLRTENLK